MEHGLQAVKTANILTPRWATASRLQTAQPACGGQLASVVPALQAPQGWIAVLAGSLAALLAKVEGLLPARHACTALCTLLSEIDCNLPPVAALWARLMPASVGLGQIQACITSRVEGTGDVKHGKTQSEFAKAVRALRSTVLI
eukprot:866175-Pelagomonas_calceolata.AAC.7